MPQSETITSPLKARNSIKEKPNQPGGLPPKGAQKNMAHMQPSSKPQKPVLYSDKSETSVEDLMDDTPSNYNIQNGRFEGKSLGLKALLLHARNNQN